MTPRYKARNRERATLFDHGHWIICCMQTEGWNVVLSSNVRYQSVFMKPLKLYLGGGGAGRRRVFRLFSALHCKANGLRH